MKKGVVEKKIRSFLMVWPIKYSSFFILFMALFSFFSVRKQLASQRKYYLYTFSRIFFERK